VSIYIVQIAWHYKARAAERKVATTTTEAQVKLHDKYTLNE